MNFVYQLTLFPNQIPVHSNILYILFLIHLHSLNPVQPKSETTNQNAYKLSYKVLTVMDFHPQSHGRNSTEKAKRLDKTNP